MILGGICTRRCKFCNVTSQNPLPLNQYEPMNIALAVKQLGLEYVVITSVTRDDLEDKGLDHYVETIKQIKNISYSTIIELLIPDFDSRRDLLSEIANSNSGVIGHNIEMVKRLYQDIRPDSDYDASLKVLSLLKEANPNIITKSAIMVGLGESKKELEHTIYDLSKTGVDILHIGQYLKPSLKHVDVKCYYESYEFRKLEDIARASGIKVVKAGPMVRSSYKAIESYNLIIKGE